MENNNTNGYMPAIADDVKLNNIVDMSKLNSMKYVSKGDLLRKSGQYKESLSCYLRSLMIERNNSASYLGLGMSYKFLNDYDKAIINLQKSAKIDSKNYEIYYEMGICYLLKSQPEKAIQCFQKSVMLDKTKLDVQLQLALAHELVDEQDMAMKIYDKLIEQYPTYLKSYSHKAALLICQGNYVEASKIFLEILKIDAGFYRAYFGLAVCFDNMKKTAEAKRYYSKFLKLRPDSTHSDYAKNRISALKNTKSNRPTYMSIV